MKLAFRAVFDDCVHSCHSFTGLIVEGKEAVDPVHTGGPARPKACVQKQLIRFREGRTSRISRILLFPRFVKWLRLEVSS